MSSLKYLVIKSKTQYKEYCKLLENLLNSKSKSKELNDEIDLLTVLIEIWDSAHNTFDDTNPIELLKHLMSEKNMRPKDLVSLLNISKGLVSDILNYKKGLSKDVIRILAGHFKISQEAFNRNYNLKTTSVSRIKNSKARKTIKQLA